MKVEQAKQIVSKAIEELSQSLERGHSETLRNYLGAIGRFHRYSLRNVMLIASQNPTATHVAGFHTWHKLGRFVKKGEKGILILAPIVRAKSQSMEQTDTDESSTAVGFLFDNSEDTISFSRFQCFDFQKMSQYPEILEPLLFYILHRANSVISDREISTVFKAFFIDEAWVFLKNPSIQRYIVEALKTWRKANAAMILSTQSLDELRRSEVLDVIIESCPTKIFLANPDMDRDLYRRQFHLNENEVDLISSLVPKQQFLIKTPELAKVANLTVDRKSYWIYTNDPFDNRKRKEAFETYGFEKGLDVLAGIAE